MSTTSAYAQDNPHDSPWEQYGQDAWVLNIEGIGRNESIVLIRNPQGTHFTATAVCSDGVYSEVYSWSQGHTHAKGVDCTGKRVSRAATYWEGWIHPLPHQTPKTIPTPTPKRRVLAAVPNTH
ncbi:hypothetical protein IPH92_03690 [Candidatus Kaiserbacteria bacterium]|nr:MAG: hypothetical protein IPH92_03690 [Candidatus Kaiserbacteria bacterium]